ncbi:hypothetical protein F511_09638 [Dorcoceras hygrometricum]|uniref:MADS-box domain-containing protein n=1 Tax=Dorcoceras hygrometricum TaxID=472368 RepID=A0A2Z7DEL4_9LAMI|nr:hypothetical protein F511_09638 [Dorcoceras hygrometricum]
MGRRRIEMKKIGIQKNLRVTFSKRRKGLFGKAGELAALCGSQIAILVQSPSNKIFAFGNPSFESVIRKYESAGTCNNSSPLEGDLTEVKKAGYFEAVARLEGQKRMGDSGKFWWDEEIEGMKLHELEEYVEELEKLRERLKIKEMEVGKESQRPWPLESDSTGVPYQNMGLDLDVFQDQIDYFMKTSEESDVQEEEIVRHDWHFDDDLWGWSTS